MNTQFKYHDNEMWCIRTRPPGTGATNEIKVITWLRKTGEAWWSRQKERLWCHVWSIGAAFQIFLQCIKQLKDLFV